MPDEFRCAATAYSRLNVRDRSMAENGNEKINRGIHSSIQMRARGLVCVADRKAMLTTESILFNVCPFNSMTLTEYG